jgi:hypothetical protein
MLVIQCNLRVLGCAVAVLDVYGFSATLGLFGCVVSYAGCLVILRTLGPLTSVVSRSGARKRNVPINRQLLSRYYLSG